MKALMKRPWQKICTGVEDGMVSAEYAVGTVATTGIAGILIWISQQDWFKELFAALFRMLFHGFLS